MFESVAIGGPRDGVKLSAEGNWDGRVLKRNNTYHPGRYMWDFEYADLRGAWVWHPDASVSKLKPPTQAGRPGQRHDSHYYK